MKTNIVLTQADALAIPLADNSVHCMVTSPPYWALRDYGVGVEMGELGQEPFADCRHYDPGPGPMILDLLADIEATLEADWQPPHPDYLRQVVDFWHHRIARAQEPCGICHVCNLVAVFREIRRVMHPSGVAWLNYGDMYATEAPRGYYGDQGDHFSQGRHGELGPQRDLANLPRGVKKGDRLLMAHRIALALQADGWWVRSAPIWRKVNPLPAPAQVYRRPVDSYEMMFMLIKDYRHYYYDAEAVREPHKEPWRGKGESEKNSWAFGQIERAQMGFASGARQYNPNGRHLRDVWDIPTQGWKGAHFATYPERLVEPCIKSTTSEYGVCAKCKAPWRRIVERSEPVPRPDNPNPVRPYTAESGHTNATGATTLHQIVKTRTAGWEPTCKCTCADVEPALVLDPFVGSGTTCKVARDLGRTSVGLDISLEYLLNEATERLITYNGIGPRLGQLRKAKPGKVLGDLPLFQGA